jgi:hypothetical protein
MPKASTAKRTAPASSAKPNLANVILLTRGKETPGAVRFEEAEVEGTPPSMGTLYVKRFFAGSAASLGVHVDKTGSQPASANCRTFGFLKDTKGCRVYEEQEIEGQAPIVGRLYLKKYFAGQAEKISLTLQKAA